MHPSQTNKQKSILFCFVLLNFNRVIENTSNESIFSLFVFLNSNKKLLLKTNENTLTPPNKVTNSNAANVQEPIISLKNVQEVLNTSWTVKYLEVHLAFYTVLEHTIASRISMQKVLANSKNIKNTTEFQIIPSNTDKLLATNSVKKCLEFIAIWRKTLISCFWHKLSCLRILQLYERYNIMGEQSLTFSLHKLY